MQSPTWVRAKPSMQRLGCRDTLSRISFTALKLRDRSTPSIGHPDVGAVKEKPLGCVADSKGAQQGAIGGPQLTHGAVSSICHPDVGPIEGYSVRTVADGKGAQQGAVASPQFKYVVVARD